MSSCKCQQSHTFKLFSSWGPELYPQNIENSGITILVGDIWYTTQGIPGPSECQHKNIHEVANTIKLSMLST